MQLALMLGRSVPRPRLCREGKEVVRPQRAGREPVRGMLKSVRVTNSGKAPGLPQLSGRVPTGKAAWNALTGRGVRHEEEASCQDHRLR